MASLFLTFLLLLDHLLMSLAQGGSGPLQVPPSTRVYGPDGPWQAVSVQLGEPAQDLDLYPGGTFQSDILTKQLCQDTSSFPCGSGGLFDPDNSFTFDNQSISYESDSSGFASQWTIDATLFSFQNSTPILEQLRIPMDTATVIVANFSAKVFPHITMVYPDGDYPLQVGQLSLGPTINQTFTQEDLPSINASLIPGDLAVQNVIPSSSFGLHIGIGAEALKLSLSLCLGGYDASRIVGPVSPQSTLNQLFIIDLLDIGIGVDAGASPFSFSSQQGLLGYGNSSITSAGTPVFMNPGAPYLYLPNSTCAAIAQHLPVTYNFGKALYFWNVSDPHYARIVTSPTYLSFVFRGSSGNLTIKVPFQLLNLTLEAPLVSTNTAYFPCQPPRGPEGQYSLGRAFLQAAFIGVNWSIAGESQWFLAQAPGPNTDPNPQSATYTGPLPIGLGKEWADTWSGFWTSLPTPTRTSTTASKTASATPVGSGLPSSPAPVPSTPSSNSLSGGAIAGIAIGGACAVLFTAAIGIWFFQRSKAGDTKATQPSPVKKLSMHVSSYPLLSRYPNTGNQIIDSPSTGGPISEPPILPRYPDTGNQTIDSPSTGGHISELPT